MMSLPQEDGVPKTIDHSSETVRQTIVETLEAPRLTNIGTENFVTFKQKREVYERQVTEKNEENGVQISLTTYRNSIKKALLHMMVTAQWVPVESVNDITEEHLRKCVEERASVSPEDYDLAQIERDIKHVKMDRKKSLEMQVWRLGLSYASALEDLGYDQFIDKRPRIAVEHIVQRISHAQLKKRMLLTLKLRKEEGLKKRYNEFMRELAKEARAIDRQDAAKGFDDFMTDSDEDGKGRAPSHRKGRIGKSNKGRGRSDGSVMARGAGSSDHKGKWSSERSGPSKKRSRPDCLNPKCNESHYMAECQSTPDALKKRFLEEYHAKKKAKKDQSRGKVMRLGAEAIDNHSSLFSATFCRGAVEAVVMADQGSDVNIIPPAVLEHMLQADKNLIVIDLPQKALYTTVDKNGPPLACGRKVIATVLLRIRHGTKMAMRDMEWLVCDRETDYVIISRHVLAAIGLDNKVLMAAACDRHDGVLNVPEMLRKHQEGKHQSSMAGSIHSLLQQPELGSTFHSHGGAEADMLDDTDVYVDLGDDPVEDLEAVLASKVEAARDNGLSSNGALKLAASLKQYQAVFEFGWANPHQPTFHL